MSSVRSLKAKADLRKAAPAILLVLNTFVWYILTYIVFNDVVNGLHLAGIEKIEVFATYFSSVAVTAIMGSKFLSRTRTKTLYLWPFLGAITTLLCGALSDQSVLINALIAFSLGASVGIGLPSCMSNFAESTAIETRGFSGGLTWAGVGVAALPFAFLLLMLGNWEAFLALAFWRFFGGVAFLGLERKSKKQPIMQPLVQKLQKSPSYFELIQNREILLYLIPWAMFSLINYVEQPILSNYFGSPTFDFIRLAEIVLGGIVAIISGIAADLNGRKRVVIAGFVMLGIEYALLSVLSSFPSSEIVYPYLVLDGITWGLLITVFFTVVWGDLGGNKAKEKYYTLGGLPYLLSSFLSIIITPFAKNISAGLTFSFASFFLFMAVIPLMYAPETLPEKTMKERELKSYVDKAKKLAQEENEKKQSTETNQGESEDSADGKEENQEEYDEARKLAEKYY